MRRRKIVVFIGLLLIVTSVAFYPSLQNDFTNWDDPIYVTKNPRIKDLSWGNVKNIFTSRHGGLYKPLTELTLAVEYHFFGLNPLVFHSTNLIFHLFNCLLVFWMVFLLSRRIEVAFIAALLFGLHPLHVESVAWVTERKDVLYAFFFLGALIAYLFYLRKKADGYYWLSLFLFFVSLLPKAQGICLPFVLLLFDYFHGRRFKRKVLCEKAPFFLISIVFLTVTIVGQHSAGHLGIEQMLTPVPTLLNVAYSLVFYLFKLVLPVKLSCFYPSPDETVGILPFLYLFSPLILGTITTVVIFSGRYTRRLIFAGLFFLINLLITLRLFHHVGPALVADRYTYIPSIGPFYLAGEFLFWLYAKGVGAAKVKNSFFLASLVGAAVLLSSLTWQRCRVWKDSRSLWRDVLAKYENPPLAHLNLGDALTSSGEAKEAIFHYTEALKINPHYVKAHINLGIALAGQGRLEETISHCVEALRVDPDCLEAHNNLGNAFLILGKFKEAVFHYSEALRIKPDCAEAFHNREIAFQKIDGAEDLNLNLTK